MARMQSLFPHFHHEWRMGSVTWLGTVKPSSLSQEYRIRIVYKQGDWPKVWVVSPPLTGLGEDTSIPHTYPGPRPCLFVPGSEDWRDDKYIPDTIVPWTSLWLYYYEIWHATGEWVGGGIHPEEKPSQGSTS